MASKRIAKTSVDWNKLQRLLPSEHQAIYTNLLAKNYQYTLKIASLPENLPKIDFESYRKQLVNSSAIEKLEKGYLAFQAPYPKDAENQLSKIDQFERDENARLVEFLKAVAKSVENLQNEKLKLTNIPPLEEMTRELEVYYFPERAPTYKEIWGEEDLYAKKLQEKHHH